MSNSRYPWQILAIAAISVIGNFYLGYYILFGLAGDGVDAAGKAGRVMVTAIWAPPAERAGLLVGDVFAEVNGQHIGTEVDWLAQRMNFEPDKPIAIRVVRAGQPVDLTMVVHGRVWDQLDRAAKTSQIIFLSNKFITLVIGLFVVFSRPKDLVSRIGGWVLVAMATVYEPFPDGLAASVRALPSVVSPEQLQGKSISPRWDIWALGVIAYESLCGTAPFVGTDYSTLRSAILGATFPKITMLVRDAPDRWHEFFGRALAPLEEDRPQSAEAFWQELKECLG